MKLFARIASFFAALALATSALAVGSGSGLVTTIWTQGNLAYAVLSAGTNAPSCASAHPGYYAIDLTTVAGQAQLELMRSAAALSRTITVIGTGTCSLIGTVETVDSLYVTYQ